MARAQEQLWHGWRSACSYGNARPTPGPRQFVVPPAALVVVHCAPRLARSHTPQRPSTDCTCLPAAYPPPRPPSHSLQGLPRPRTSSIPLAMRFHSGVSASRMLLQRTHPRHHRYSGSMELHQTPRQNQPKRQPATPALHTHAWPP